MVGRIRYQDAIASHTTGKTTSTPSNVGRMALNRKMDGHRDSAIRCNRAPVQPADWLKGEMAGDEAESICQDLFCRLRLTGVASPLWVRLHKQHNIPRLTCEGLEANVPLENECKGLRHGIASHYVELGYNNTGSPSGPAFLHLENPSSHIRSLPTV